MRMELEIWFMPVKSFVQVPYGGKSTTCYIRDCGLRLVRAEARFS
jgi:hypothetical protein